MSLQSSLEYRKLTNGDLSELEQLVRKHNRVQRVIYDTSALDLKANIENFWGAFAEKELVCVLNVAPWGKMNYYAVSGLYIKPGLLSHFSWSPEKNPAVVIFYRALAEMESQGRFNWYYTRSIDRWPAKMREAGRDFFSTSGVGNTYTRYIQEIVRAGTRSKVEMHDRLLGQRTWEVDVAVFMCAKKNEFRNFDYKLEDEIC